MIVALAKPGDESYDTGRRQATRAPRARRDGDIVVSCAFHAPVAHVLKMPCIYFAPKPRWAQYPLVHERNVIPILVHESIHCAVQRLMGFNRDMGDVQKAIDRRFVMVGDL
jgi:hypothetical protein